MGQFAGARASTGNDTLRKLLQQLADRVRRLELYYTLPDTPAGRDGASSPARLRTVGEGEQAWQLGVDEQGRLVARDPAGRDTILAVPGEDGGRV